MTTEAAVTVGDFIVSKGRWSYSVLGPVTKVTAAQVQHPAEYNPKRTARTALDSVLFAGDEATARRLAEQLKSSAALCDEEQRAASRRHQEREQKLIAEAEGRSDD